MSLRTFDNPFVTVFSVHHFSALCLHTCNIAPRVYSSTTNNCHCRVDFALLPKQLTGRV